MMHRSVVVRCETSPLRAAVLANCLLAAGLWGAVRAATAATVGVGH